jgi:hypothetical protein
MIGLCRIGSKYLFVGSERYVVFHTDYYLPPTRLEAAEVGDELKDLVAGLDHLRIEFESALGGD